MPALGTAPDERRDVMATQTKPRINREILNLLEKLAEVTKAEYPADLLAARRAAFIAQVKKTCPAGTGQVRS
jgi:hypothetical protein